MWRIETIELFDGIFRVTPIVFFLDIVLIIHFIHSYYRYCYRCGFKIDPWHWGLFIPYFISTLIMYPFSGSELNVFTIGQDLYQLQSFIDNAFIITICGYFTTYLGFYYFNITQKNHKDDLLYLISNTVSLKLVHIIQKVIDSKSAIYILSVIVCIVNILITFGAIMKYGFTLNLRFFAMTDLSFRPIFNFMYSSCIPLISSFILVRYLKTKEKALIIYYIILVFLAVFSGMRSAVLGPIMGIVMLYVYYQKRNVSLLKIGLFGFGLMIAALYIESVRSENTDLFSVLFSIGATIFFGNNFSDVRDFAWILSYWDSEYIMGKSYLAGIMSFIPRSFSEFREIWSISIYTTQTLVGMDENHPGLRPGPFGEIYLNFGIIGVLILGFIGGYILKYIDFSIKKNINSQKKDYVIGYSYTFANIFISIFYMSAATWSIYVFFIILFFGYLIAIIFSNKRFK